MNRKCGRWGWLMLGVFASLAARAENGGDMEKMLSSSLEELMLMDVSISTQTPQPIGKAPSVVSVITADELRATGATNLVDVLENVPGVHIRTNQFGFRPLVSVRGAAAKNALIMVNGSPLRDLVWATGIFWKGLPVSAIERIEIIRGPASALYGSDASAGVINIITKTAAPIRQSETGMRIGSFGSQSAWLQHGAQWNGLDIGVTAEVSTTDGHRPFIQRDRIGRSGDADFGYDNLDLRLSVSRDNWRIFADHMQKDDYGIGITGGSYLDPVTRAKDRFTGLAWLYGNRQLADHWGVDAEVRYRDMAYSSGNGFWEVPASAPGATLNQLRSAEQRLNAEASLVHTGFRGHALRFGGGYVWQDLYSVEQRINGVKSFFAPEKARHNVYLFAQDVWKISDQWELTAGGRYDHYSEVGGSFNPRLALVWQTTDRLTTKLMYGKAFRAPSFLELYAVTGATNPNANLVPEKSTTWDLSFSLRASPTLQLGMNLFDYLQKNPIVDAGGTFRNVDPHTIRGIEFEALWQVMHTLRLAGNITWRRPDDAQFTRLRVPDHFAIPDRDGHLRLDWALLPKWNWNLQVNWIGDRKQALTDTREPLGGQTLVDTTLRYFHGSEWEFAASIRNLLDADVYEYTGTPIRYYLPLPGRSAFVEARYKF